MTEIIVCTNEPRPIGYISHGKIVTPPNKEWKRVTIQILAESNVDEYLQFTEEQGVRHMVLPSIYEEEYFYKVKVLD